MSTTETAREKHVIDALRHAEPHVSDLLLDAACDEEIMQGLGLSADPKRRLEALAQAEAAMTRWSMK